jgi:hypothetical protein
VCSSDLLYALPVSMVNCLEDVLVADANARCFAQQQIKLTNK